MTVMDEAKKLLGKQVVVTLDRDEWITIPNDEVENEFPSAESSTNPNPNPVIAKGKLLSFSDYGEFVIEEEDGSIQYCWPMLDIKEA